MCEGNFDFACGGGIAALALTLVFCIPVKTENVQKSLEILDWEGSRPIANVLSNQGDYQGLGFHPAVLDTVTDADMLRIALAETADPLHQAMDMSDYARYWHGYVLILRPLLYFMDYSDFRIWNCFLQIALVCYIAFLIWKATGMKRYVLAFLTSYALLMPPALFLSLQYSWAFYLSFGGILLVVKKSEFLSAGSNYAFFFLIVGMMTSFFDLLTFPLLTWGFPVIWWIVMKGDKMGGAERFKKVVFSGVSWVAGYALFWILKWVIATLVLGRNVIADGIGEAFYRVSDEGVVVMSLMQVYDRWEVLYCNWRPYEYGAYSALLIAWMIWAVFCGIWNGWKVRAGSGVYLLVALSSIVWYLALFNHTVLHHFFTYRIYGVSILAFLCLLAEMVPAACGAGRRTWGEMIRGVGGWFCFFLAGLALSTLAREDVLVLYGGDYCMLTVEEDDVLEMKFIPSFSEIRRIGFCMQSLTGEGSYQVSVFKGEEPICQKEFLLLEHVDTFYHDEEVQWKLRAGEEYRLQITFRDSGTVELLATEEGCLPLDEYRGMQVNGEMKEEQQPLSGILYHARVRSRFKLLYAASLWSVLLSVAWAILRKRHRGTAMM